MKHLNKIAAFFILCITCSLLSCSKDENPEAKGKLKIEFLHEVNGQPLVLNDQVFTNRAGNAYRIEKLKYYISNIELIRANGAVLQIPDGYFLIEETNLDSRTMIELADIPASDYQSLSFAIGVDSARNFSTEMVGELNPNNDMAWNWVSGYKFFLLEGKFTTHTQAPGSIVYHIGGNQSLRKVTLSPGSGPLQVSGNKTTELGISTDINSIFNTKTIIDLNEINAVMQPGNEADKIADNYASGMFQLHHLTIK